MNAARLIWMVVMQGYVYILFNPHYRQHYYKIGKTTRHPAIRAKELSGATGVPGEYEVHHYVLVRDCGAAEARVRERLLSKGIPRTKEFHVLEFRLARQIVDEVADEIGRVDEAAVIETSSPTTKERVQGGDSDGMGLDFVPPTAHIRQNTVTQASGSNRGEELCRLFWIYFLSKIRERDHQYDTYSPVHYKFITIKNDTIYNTKFYFILTQNNIRAEFWNSTKENKEAERLYKNLSDNKAEIEAKIGHPLEWLKFPTGFRISYYFAEGDYRNKDDWERLTQPAADAMEKLRQAMREFATLG